MMPHPERAAAAILGNTDGLKVFAELFQIVPEPVAAF
jgi:phosphoribosylformylglycinamidine (FGAM) synthase-like amidotransferase family enzyme